MPAPPRRPTGSVLSGAASVTGEERRLVAAVLQHDRKATAELVSRHADAVHAYVRHRLVPRTDLVDDLVQEVFLAALKGLQRFAGQSSLRSWLLGIARHRVADHYRTVLRRDERSDLDEDDMPGVVVFPALEDQLDRARAQEKTRRILAQLPESYAYALVWRYWEGRSAREIAAEIGKTEKAVERLLARARARFKGHWEID